MPAGGQFVDEGNVQIPVEDQGQGPGNGSGGQYQHMGCAPLCRQSSTLSDSKPVLFVNDHQTQVIKVCGIGKQRMSAYHNLGGTYGHIVQHTATLCPAHGSGDQDAGDA